MRGLPHRSDQLRKFFFIHVMKTGGTTLRLHIRSNFRDPEVFPNHLDEDKVTANIELSYLAGLPADRRKQTRVFTGHFPFVAVEMLGLDVTTLTMLRDPVERTVSYLRHCRRFHEQHRDLALEEIYEDPFFFPALIKNHQSKLFAMTLEDRPRSYLDRIEIDEERLATAKENLERVDVVGLHERYDEFLAELETRFGWARGVVSDKYVGEGPGATKSLRRRIAEDNRADIEFYEHARALCEGRSAARGSA